MALLSFQSNIHLGMRLVALSKNGVSGRWFGKQNHNFDTQFKIHLLANYHALFQMPQRECQISML